MEKRVATQSFSVIISRAKGCWKRISSSTYSEKKQKVVFFIAGQDSLAIELNTGKTLHFDESCATFKSVKTSLEYNDKKNEFYKFM